MRNKCDMCGAATILFVCDQCMNRMHRKLLGLPRLIGHLEDAAVGKVKLGDPQNVSTGAFGSVVPTFDDRAKELATQLKSTLAIWAARIADKYRVGITHSPTVPEHYVHAVFLAGHIGRVCREPDVGELGKLIENGIRRGLHIVNRAVPPQFCGPCPNVIVGNHDRCGGDCNKREHDCGTRLMANRGAIEVTCPACGATHSVESLVTHLLARADHHRCTIPELHRVLRMLDEPVSLSTLYRWAEPKTSRRNSGLLRPAGYLRVDKKSIGLTRHDPKDQAVYRVSEARKLRVKMASSQKTGRPYGSTKAS